MESIEVEDGMVLEAVSPTEPRSVDEIAKRCELGNGLVMTVLSRQQRAGKVEGVGDFRFVRCT